MTVLTINRQVHVIEAEPDTPLVFVLRNELGLTGTKLGCASEECGACAVLVNGKSTLSCVRPVTDFADQEIVTIEGLAEDAVGQNVQQAFVEEGAAQCGYCTPGIVIATTALLQTINRPTDRNIYEALDRHLCRCGSQPRVLAAIQRLID